MTKLRAVVLLAVVALLLFPAAAFAQPPALPCHFHGTVTVDGQDVDAGTVVKAIVAGTEFTTTTPAAAYGDSTYEIMIEQPEGATYDGATVTFMIGERTADQSATWVQGGNVEANISSGEGGGQGGGSITQVVVTSLPAGSEPTVSYNAATGVLTIGIPDGATGATGPAGAAGPQGEEGKGAPGGIALPVIALVIAIVAAGMAMMATRRKV
jgi:hypothetical protein